MAVPVISVGAYPFWLFRISFVPLRIQKQLFSGWNVLRDNKETDFGSSNPDASPSAGKNTRVLLMACFLKEVRPYNYLKIFMRSLGVICYGK